MSRFFHTRYANLVPYTAGEQPRERTYIKLNTNESPYPPSPRAVAAAKEELTRLQLYSDPTAKALNERFAALVGVGADEVMATNGSDEILNFAFMAFCGADRPAVFPDVTYGFYPVFANLHGIPYTEVPLKEDFTVDVQGLCEAAGTVFLANPNAPTGIALPAAEISPMAPESAVAFLWNDRIGEAASRAELVQKWKAECASPEAAACDGSIDDVIDPAELRQRISAMVHSGDYNDFVCTIDGFCVKFLRREIYRLGFPR